MTLKRLLTAAAAFTLAAGGAMAQTPAPAAPAPAAAKLVANGDIAQTLKLSEGFQTFARAADMTNLTTFLKNNPHLTVFAPTDAAFAALPPGELDVLMRDKPRLQKLLTYHIINAAIDDAFMKTHSGTLPTAAGLPVDIQGGGAVIKINDASVVQPEVKAANGIVHVIDKVLTPGSVATAPPPVAAAPTTGAASAAATATAAN